MEAILSENKAQFLTRIGFFVVIPATYQYGTDVCNWDKTHKNKILLNEIEDATLSLFQPKPDSPSS